MQFCVIALLFAQIMNMYLITNDILNNVLGNEILNWVSRSLNQDAISSFCRNYKAKS